MATPAPRPTLHRESQLWSLGYVRVAGIDEAGRGPLAGPVVAAAVVLTDNFDCPHLERLNDSKQLTAAWRDSLYDAITGATPCGVGIVEAPAIDLLNIRQASWHAMRLAVADLVAHCGDPIDYALVDGYPYGAGPWPYEGMVKGDAVSLSIAAASVIAKVTRDRIMVQHHEQYPQYGFAGHKGYSCAAHFKALEQHGPCPLHRRSFAPIRGMRDGG